MSEGMAVRAEEPSGMAQATAHSNSTSTQTTALFISTSEYELRCELPSRSQLTLPYCMPGLQPEDQTKVQWNSAGQRGLSGCRHPHGADEPLGHGELAASGQQQNPHR